MDIIYTSCCGLDVHKRSVQACVRRMEKSGKIHHEVRTFSTMTGRYLGVGRLAW